MTNDTIDATEPEEGQSGPLEYSRTTTFEFDNTTANLSSSKEAREITEAARRAVRNNLRSWTATGDVVHLSHGTSSSQPASLVVFRFRFRFEPRSSNRFSRAEIQLQLHAADKDERADPPAIVQYAPRLVHSTVTTANIEKSKSVMASINAPAQPSPVSVGVHGSATSTRNYSKEARTEILGQAWTSDEADERGLEHDDAVCWTLTENKDQADGIPREVTAAVLVASPTAANFRATVQVRCRTSSGIWLFGWPWARPTPLIIRSDVAFGRLTSISSFDELDEEQWGSFVVLDRPYSRIKVSEQYPERDLS